MGKYAMIWFLVFAVAVIVIDMGTPYDDTDDIENGVRSGMILYTDNLTGCQYLRAGVFSDMVVRVDGDGAHVGCK